MSIESVESTKAVIRSLLPGLIHIISDLQSSGGYLNLTPEFAQELSNKGLEPWSAYYEDISRMRGLVASTLFSQEQITKYAGMLASLDANPAQAIRETIKQKVIDGVFEVKEALSLSENSSRSASSELSPPEQIELQQFAYTSYYAMLTHLHHYLAFMTFGKNICELVNEAKNGEDIAFCRVIQIDRTALFGIEYFRNRLIKAQLCNEPIFLKDIANAFRQKSLGGKFKYPSLLLIIAILDDERVLEEVSTQEIMEISYELKIYPNESEFADPESLRRLIDLYRVKFGNQK